MITIQIRVTNTSRARIVFSAIFVVITLVLSLFVFNSTSSGEQTESTAAFIPTESGRHFYLTEANYYPDEALNACTAGYHMASLWEILDVSNLSYDYDHPDAYTQDDSGSGPPASWYGWVRTGRNSSGSSTAGSGNCLAWTSRGSSHYGTAVQLADAWESAPGEIGTWNAGAFQCSIIGPVWCAGEFSQTNLPVIVKE